MAPPYISMFPSFMLPLSKYDSNDGNIEWPQRKILCFHHFLIDILILALDKYQNIKLHNDVKMMETSKRFTWFPCLTNKESNVSIISVLVLWYGIKVSSRNDAENWLYKKEYKACIQGAQTFVEVHLRLPLRIVVATNVLEACNYRGHLFIRSNILRTNLLSAASCPGRAKKERLKTTAVVLRHCGSTWFQEVL